MDDLGNPQLILDCIHIGGTNGKGSTTNYIKEVLKQAGYRVATFTSPALYSRLDIIRINDQFIDDKTMVKYANRYVDLWLKYEISMFEIEVFIAIMYFIENNVDIAIFEVGLGGLLDATNIIKPMLAINTNIGLDHVDYLGHDYQSIALNKAGMKIVGKSPDGLLPEIVERPDHPWFIGVQFHPELKSKPFAPHPLFVSFVKAAIEQSRLI